MGGAPRQRQALANQEGSLCRVTGQTTKQKSLLNSGREAGGGGEGAGASGVWRPHLSPFTGGNRRRAARPAERAAAR